MSDTVAEFCSKKGVKKFKCGVEKLKSKAMMATMVLATAFAVASSKPAYAKTVAQDPIQTMYAITDRGDTICSYNAICKDRHDEKLLSSLMNNAAETETGREVLRGISKCGTTLSIDAINENMVGFFDPASNRIIMGNQWNEAQLQSFVVHEGKHAIQNAEHKISAGFHYDFASAIMRTRAMEADAMATQTKFAYELMKTGNDDAWVALEEDHSDIARTFEKGIESGQNINDVMKKTMLAWYDDKDYTGNYDDHIIEYYQNVSDKYEKQSHQLFTRQHNPDEIIQKICKINGQSYAGSDGSILQEPRTLYLSNSNYKAISKALKKTTDTSFDKFYKVSWGKTSTMTFAQENAAKVAEKAAKNNKNISKNVSPYLMKQKSGRGH